MSNHQDTHTPPETFSMRVAARMSGVAPERLRAWESRHQAIRPMRTAGGTRRYSLSDLDRLRLLLRVVEAGHRIGDIAQLTREDLIALLPVAEADASLGLDDLLPAIEGLDPATVRRLLAAKQRALGPLPFARDFAIPLSFEIGQRWADGVLSVASEHLATNIIRSLLVESLAGDDTRSAGARIVFATPSGERHDLGLLVAALIAKEAGAVPIVLGADVPDEDLLDSVRSTRAEALALGFVTSPPDRVEEILRGLRGALPESVALWIGGSGIDGCASIRGVDRVENLDRLEAFVLSLPNPGA